MGKVIGGVVFLLVIGVFVVMTGEESAPETETVNTVSNETDVEEASSAPTEVADQVVSDDVDEDTTTETENSDGDADMGMPVPEVGNEVDEMIVEDDSAVEEEVSTVEFTVDSFGFGYSMEEIRVKQGDTVTINLTNSQGFHDWVVDEFGAATDKISEGETTSVTFVASEAGSFEYYCSVGNHRQQGMVGTLIVE